MYLLQTIMPMYTIAIATAKLMAVTKAMSPEGIGLLFSLSLDFTASITSLDCVSITVLSACRGATELTEVSLVLVSCFEVVTATSIA